MADPIFIVWGPGGSPNPRVRHHHRDAAQSAARGMARSNPGQSFYVMQALDRYEVPLGAVEHTDMLLAAIAAEPDVAIDMPTGAVRGFIEGEPHANGCQCAVCDIPF